MALEEDDVRALRARESGRSEKKKLEAMASWSLLLAFLKWISLAWCHGGVSGVMGMPWGAFRVSWGCLGVPLGCHGKSLGSFGVSWECLWESLGCLGMS